MKTAFDVSIGSFWVFSKKKSDTLYHSRTQSKLFSAFSRLFSSKVVRKNYLIFCSILDFERKTLASFRKKAARLPRLHSTCLQERFQKECLEKVSSLFSFFGPLAKKKSAFHQSLSDEVVKCVIYLSIGKLWRNFFSGNFFKFSVFLRILPGKNSVFRQVFFGRV